MGGKRTPCRLPEKSRPGSTRWQIFYFFITQYREQNPFQKQFGAAAKVMFCNCPVKFYRNRSQIRFSGNAVKPDGAA